MSTLGVVAWGFRPTTTPLLDDELYWVGSAYYFDLAVVRRDGSHADWRLLPARENPPVAKYVLGLGFTATGQPVNTPDILGCFYLGFEKTPGAWGEGAERLKRQAVTARMDPATREQVRQGAQVSLAPRLIVTARVMALACVLGASGFVLLLGRALGGWRTGLVASQLLLLHPVVVAAYNHALADGVALMFSAMVAWWATRWVARAAQARAWSALTVAGFAGGGGVLLALALGAKMNSLVVGALLGGAVAGAALRAWRRRDARRAGQMVAAGVGAVAVALVTFIAINPAIWGDVAGGLAACVQEHRVTEAIQAKFLAGHLTTLAGKLGAMAALATFGVAGLALVAAVAGWALAAGGDAVRLCALWWLLAVLAVAVWIPFEWSRYVAPVVPPTVLLVAWLLTVQVPAIWTRWVATDARLRVPRAK